jgi:hypothetical protein
MDIVVIIKDITITCNYYFFIVNKKLIITDEIAIYSI